MRGIGVRELKVHASEIIQSVREQKARYVITYRGQPVGLLTPLEPTANPAMSGPSPAGEAVLAELDRLGAAIGAGWSSPQTSAELLSDLRR